MMWLFLQRLMNATCSKEFVIRIASTPQGDTAVRAATATNSMKMEYLVQVTLLRFHENIVYQSILHESLKVKLEEPLLKFRDYMKNM